MNQRNAARGRDIDRRHLHPGRPPANLSPNEFRVRLTPELMAVLDLFTEQTGLSRAALVREAVANWAFRLGALPTPDVPLTNYNNRKDTA